MLFRRIYDSPTMMAWASYFVRFGSALFVLPLILKLYTPIEQSFWFFISTITAFAMLADSGIGPTVIRAVSYFHAGADYLPKNKKEYDEIDKIQNKEPNLENLKNLLSTVKRIYIYIGVFSIVMVSTGGLAAAWNILELSDHQIDLWIAFLVVIPYCFFSILSVKWSSFMRGLGFIAQESRFGVFQGVIRIMIFVILLLLKFGPAFLLGFMLLESIIRYFYIRWFVLKWFREKGIVFEEKGVFDHEIFKPLWSATWRTGILFWGAYGVQSGTSILASQINDALLMANFLFTMRIVNFVLNIARAPFYTNVPKIYKLAAEKDMKGLQKKSSGYMSIGLGIMVAAFAVVILFGNPALELLGSDTKFIGLTIIMLIAVTEILDLHSSFHATIYTSTNHVPFALPAILSGGAILLIGFNVMPVYGLIGIVFVKFAIQFMFSNWYAPILSLRLMNWPIAKYLYQFPQYGFAFIREIVETNILRRK